MPQHQSYEVVERLNQTLLYLGEGLTAVEISNKLKVSKEQTYKDIQAIKKAGAKFLTSLGNKELAHLYNVWLSNRFHINKELWAITRDPDITHSDKIRAYKTMIENDNSAREALKESVNLLVVEELKHRLQQLEEQNNKPELSKSYFNQVMPELTNPDTITPVTNTQDHSISDNSIGHDTS
jgi:hypothetical protein